jgi:CHAT domain-containing protein
MHASFAGASYLLLVKRDRASLTRSGLGDDDLTRLVAALRRSLTIAPNSVPRAADFAADEAYALYCALLGPFDGGKSCGRNAPAFVFASETRNPGEAVLVPGDELLVVPDRDAQQIALGPLLTAPLGVDPDYDALRGAQWLGVEHSLTTMPSVAALAHRRTRGERQESKPARPLVGFAPIFSPECLAAGGPALAPLPETEAEIVALARRIGGRRGVDWFTCRIASEAEVRRQDLRSVGTLLFASHAEVAGAFGGSAEPGIFLAPPSRPTATEDGYLAASEIATLDIGAEVVILSACSTAAPSGLPGAPGMSGLARAFFEAGAGTLMVSHWNVGSRPTAMLTEDVAQSLASDPDITPAEALRNAIIRRLHDPMYATHAHPALWAPFVIVGLG